VSRVRHRGRAEEGGPGDAHLAGRSRDPRRYERRIGVAFALSMLAFIGLTVLYGLGGQPQLEGALLLAGLGSLGYGLAAWGKELMPQGPFSQEVEDLVPSEEDKASFWAAFARGEESIARRSVLGKLLLGALGTLVAALVFPIRSLGPNPGRSLFQTSWRKGSRVVTPDGAPVPVSALKVGGVLTVFPEGHTDAADSQTLLIKASDRPVVTRRGREAWSPEGYLAYSKVCTHAGCPVGLYQQQRHQLLCPCHQSTFDVLTGCTPVFGPATRSLPQLPLAVDADGFLVAQSDYREPIGPGFWNRDRSRKQT
jgi:ubiquinol-cytochrome c reductase iron-sulfur subunit